MKIAKAYENCNLLNRNYSSKCENIRSSTLSLTTLILHQIVLKYVILGLSLCFLSWEGNFSSGESLLQFNITKYLIHCPTCYIFGWFLMSHKKCLIFQVFLESLHGIPQFLFWIVHKSCLWTKCWIWLSKVSHLNFSLNTHFFVKNISSANPYFLVCHFHCCLTSNAFWHI